MFKSLFNRRRLITGPLMMTVCINISMAQFSRDNSSVSWGIENLDPVKVEVEESRDELFVRFNAKNSTLYPFIVRIDFRNVQNLMPRPSSKEMVLKSGSNQVITLYPTNKNAGYGYEYSYSYYLLSDEEKVDLSWPYLVPLKPGTVPRRYGSDSGPQGSKFKAEKGDTVFCMRKGIVTALPGGNKNDFRISRNEELEVLHDDGTYMIYSYPDCRGFIKSIGTAVLPGQALGVVSDSLFIWVRLAEFSISNTMLFHPIRYATGENSATVFDGIVDRVETVHPAGIVTREMSKSESKKYLREAADRK